RGLVTQIVGAPVTATKLGIIGRQTGLRRSVVELWRYIRVVAAFSWPATVGGLGPKKLIPRFVGLGLPSTAAPLHFGGRAGTNAFESAIGAIVIGRQMPRPRELEDLAGVLTGKMPEPLPEGDRFTWYPRREARIWRVDGTFVTVQREFHPDPVVDALLGQA